MKLHTTTTAVAGILLLAVMLFSGASAQSSSNNRPLTDEQIRELKEQLGLTDKQVEDLKAQQRRRREVTSPRVRVERQTDCDGKETGESDLVFEVSNGAKVGVRKGGGETVYLDDIPADSKKAADANLHAIGLGVEIGKAFVNNFTHQIMDEVAKVPALQLENRVMPKVTKLEADQVTLTHRITLIEDECPAGTFQEKPAVGTGDPSNYKAPVCKDLTICEEDEYESVAPTASSDRECKDTTKCKEGTSFEVRPPAPTYDRICKAVTECKDNEMEEEKPTLLKDRICKPAATDCRPYAGQGDKLQKVKVGTTTIDAFCLNDGTFLGGDGTSKEKAGKSCATIRTRFKAKEDKAYYVFMDDRQDPVQVYCDMNSCGNDWMAWGDRTEDYERCGGWTMVVKAAGTETCSQNSDQTKGCYYLNRNNVQNWREGKAFGSHFDIKQENAMSPAYSRQSISDVMFRSIEPLSKTNPWVCCHNDRKNRPWQSVAWRHAWREQSVREIARTCKERHDGVLLTHHGRAPSTGEIYHSFSRGMNWASRSEHDHYLPENYKTRYGFFVHDDGSCANNRPVVGCNFEWSGHSRSFMGVAYGRNPNMFGGGWSYRITSFGVASGYCGGAYHSFSGHWWGHGSSNMQVRSTAVFVRDKAEMEGWRNSF